MKRIAISMLVCLLMITVAAYGEPVTLSHGGVTIKLGGDGDIISVAGPGGVELAQSAAGDNGVRVGVVPEGRKPGDLPLDELLRCRRPSRDKTGGATATMEYDLSPELPLKVRCLIQIVAAGNATAIKRTVTLVPTASPIKQDVLLVVANNLAPGGAGTAFVPHYKGFGEESTNVAGRVWQWNLNGNARADDKPAEPLALPMISHAAGGLRLTHVADPYFTTSFRLADTDSKADGEFSCIYLGTKVPMTKAEERTFWTVIHDGGADEAIEAWYATALAGIPPGPKWLRDVAWQHYDYLSHGGKGWFEDIDVAEKLVPDKADRAKIVFTLHGWYGLLGRYAYDDQTGKLDDEWTAFSNYEAVKDKGFPSNKPVKMSKAEMHRRIRYPKDRGFRVCVYFADGLNACDSIKETFAEDQVLTWGGWVGPDTVGKTYQRNPAHPKVFAWYVNYLKALLAEYGDEVDAFVWDETFHAPAGSMSGGKLPAYASRAMMRLVRELTLMTTKHRDSLAFLVSDCQGVSFDGKDYWLHTPGYGMVAHGCYQDSHCEPGTWPYGVFANYRNVLWSCNWQAVTHFDYTEFGVKHYGTPVATSNGWLDDKGIAGLTAAQRQTVLDLFNARKDKPQQLKWLTGPAPVFTAAQAAK